MINLGIRHPFFNALWRRIATTVFLVLWTLWELSNKEMFWATMIGALTVVCIYTFFFSWRHMDGPDG